MIHFFTIKTSENVQIFNIFMGYRSETLVENELMAYYYYFNKNLHHKSVGIIHLVSTQNYPKNLDFLPPDRHTFVCILRV